MYFLNNNKEKFSLLYDKHSVIIELKVVYSSFTDVFIHGKTLLKNGLKK